MALHHERRSSDPQPSMLCSESSFLSPRCGVARRISFQRLPSKPLVDDEDSRFLMTVMLLNCAETGLRLQLRLTFKWLKS
eukprot:3938115-Rhodomonas_salina.3